MKRLTWITFIFLPLLFVASLFGMNLDILETGPVKWWWYVVLSFSLFVMVLAGWAMFKYYSTVSGWCGSLAISLWNKLPPIPIPSREKSNLMEDLENGSHKNSKFKST
ncbi:hypothetical protein DFP73DRAFT_569569 [Morchella snyderi]|nr:hypothetical protein DFP73DRAFT_569569 [Morchella snyderi]